MIKVQGLGFLQIEKYNKLKNGPYEWEISIPLLKKRNRNIGILPPYFNQLMTNHVGKFKIFFSRSPPPRRGYFCRNMYFYFGRHPLPSLTSLVLKVFLVCSAVLTPFKPSTSKLKGSKRQQIN